MADYARTRPTRCAGLDGRRETRSRPGPDLGSAVDRADAAGPDRASPRLNPLGTSHVIAQRSCAPCSPHSNNAAQVVLRNLPRAADRTYYLAGIFRSTPSPDAKPRWRRDDATASACTRCSGTADLAGSVTTST